MLKVTNLPAMVKERSGICLPMILFVITAPVEIDKFSIFDKLTEIVAIPVGLNPIHTIYC